MPPVKSSASPPPSQDFESALAALEALVARIESADLPLEDMIRDYEESSKLLRLCEERLQSARQRVDAIASQNQNGVEIAPFAGTPVAGDVADAASAE